MTLPALGVVGAGAWGTALAQMLAGDGRTVLLWALEPELVEEINARRSNSLFLPSATLAPSIRATGDLAEAAECDVLLLVTPAQHLGATLARMPAFPRDLVLCAKGIEARSGRMMHEVAADAAPSSEIAVLSGPTFAHEVAAGLPTAVTLACGGGKTQWQRLAPAIARPAFRPYYSDDLIGAEVGGAVKNVLAIACGVVEGLQLGQNARAALIARGYAEMQRFGEALGAERLAEALHLGIAARDQRGTGVLAELEALDHAAGDREHVLDRAADFGADQVVAVIGAEGRPGDGWGKPLPLRLAAAAGERHRGR